MLLVHYCQCEVRYIDRVLDECVRTDDHVYHTRGHQAVEVVLRALAMSAKQKSDHERAVDPRNFDSLNVPSGQVAHVTAHQSADGKIVLFGEDFGRGHERGLASAVNGGQHGHNRHDGLAASDVPLQQSVHGTVRPDVGQHVLHRLKLSVGELERQRIEERAERRSVEG